MPLAALSALGLVVDTAIKLVMVPPMLPNSDAASQWGGVMGTLGEWLPANAKTTPGTLPTGMAQSGATVTGQGAIEITGEASDLGAQLAVAAGCPSDDQGAIDYWTLIAEAIIENFEQSMYVNPSGFIGVPTSGGPITGSGTIGLTSAALGGRMVAKTNVQDDMGIAGLQAYGDLLEAQIVILGTALALGFIGVDGAPLQGESTIL